MTWLSHNQQQPVVDRGRGLYIDNRLLTVAISLIVIRPDRYANRPNTDADLFCSGRHCAANTCCGSNYHCNSNSLGLLQ